MNFLKVELKNCYGIKYLNETFDFSQRTVHAVYAANGCMKTSFAQTFKDLSDGVASCDRVFKGRQTVRTIEDGNGNEIAAEDVLVIRPMDDVIGYSERNSLLLVNAALRQEYEQLYAEVDTAQKELLVALRAVSGVKKALDDEMSETLAGRRGALREALFSVQSGVAADTAAVFREVPYSLVFDEKSLEVFSKPDVQNALDDYIKHYTKLLEESAYFSKGVFNFHNGNTVAKNLESNGFFRANHSLKLNSGESVEVKTERDLLEVIEREKLRVLNDQALKSKFDQIEKLIRNQTVREVQDLLSDHPEWVPELSDIQNFKKKVWTSYLSANRDAYNALISAYQRAEAGRLRIEDEARQESTLWEQVIDIFNDRFVVPFKLVVENRERVVIGQEPLTLGFRFEDGTENESVNREDLTRILSAGEKRAFYILNVLFEVELRRGAQRTSLVIVDDIADSFDYKNKYAIVEYLKEISDSNRFRMILLTHNFDFFRTILSRGVVGRNTCKVATRDDTGIHLKAASGINNVFVKEWKRKFDQCGVTRIACIPFMRNLIEFTKGSTDGDYVLLTSLLHVKPDTHARTLQDLYTVYNNLFDATYSPSDVTTPVIDLVKTEAVACTALPDGLNLESKVVLSIAIRLIAEEFMLAKINNQAAANSITSNQTYKLLALLEQEGGTCDASIRVLKRVLLMTSENIHLNSFMYEPIIDLSDSHLRKLHGDVLAL